MEENTKQPKKVAYICEGSCHAEISQEEYDKGLQTCGAKDCTHFGHTFKKIEEQKL